MLLCALAACAALALVVTWVFMRGPVESVAVSAAEAPVSVAHPGDVRVDAATELDDAAADQRVAGAPRAAAPFDMEAFRRAREEQLRSAKEREAVLAGKLRVRVVDERGGVLTELTGSVQCDRTRTRGAETDALPYERDAVLPAEGVLVIDKLAFGEWTVTVDVRDRDASARVELTAESPERDIDVVLAPWRDLRVKLCEPNGAPLLIALEREFPGQSVLLELELIDQSENSVPSAERTSIVDDPHLRLRRAVAAQQRRGGALNATAARDRITTSHALRCRRVASAVGDDTAWRTLAVSSFGPLSLTVRFGQLVVAHGNVEAGAEDVTLFATLDVFRAALRTLRVNVVDGATEQPLAGVSVRLRWDQVETNTPRFTDGNGGVAFAHELARKVQVDVVPRGYDAVSEAVEIAPDADSSVIVRVFRPGMKPVGSGGGKSESPGAARH